MAIRALLALLAVLLLVTPIGVFRLPADLSLYVGDRYYVVRKMYLALLFFVHVAIPLALWSVKHFPATR